MVECVASLGLGLPTASVIITKCTGVLIEMTEFRSMGSYFRLAELRSSIGVSGSIW